MIWIQKIFQDLKYGSRSLTRNPGPTAVMVLSLAVGIGVNTAVFTAYKAFVARPVDADKAHELVNIALVRGSGAAEYAFSYFEYETYRESVRAFKGLAAFHPVKVTLSNAGSAIANDASSGDSPMRKLGLMPARSRKAEFAFAFAVSRNYFDVLGMRARRGRVFDQLPDQQAATTNEVLISENYWRRRFSADPSMLGKVVQLNGVPVTIVGITPQDFTGTGVGAPAFWIPLDLEPALNATPNWLTDRENRRYRMVGRLASGVTPAQASSQITAVADHLKAMQDTRHERTETLSAIVWPGSPFPLPLSYYPGLMLSVFLIMAGAAMVLIVAAANVGGLQLARVRSREHELRTRLSLGATRTRIIGQLLTESALLGIAACPIALFVSWVFLKLGVKAFVDAMPVEFGAFVFDVTPDYGVFAFVLLISLAAGVLAGLAPALQSSHAALTATARASTSSARARKVQDILVSAQVALSLVLMIAASMFVRGAMNWLFMESGYDSQHVVKVDLQFPVSSNYNEERKAALIDEFRTRLSELPGVASTTIGRPPGSGIKTAVAIASEADQPSVVSHHILHYTYAQENYFETLGIPLLAGGGLNGSGTRGRAVIVSASAARSLWGEADPVGRGIRLGPIDERGHTISELVAGGPVYTVAAVARDTRGSEFDGSDTRLIYVLAPGGRAGDRPLLVRTIANPAQLIATIDRLTDSVDPQVDVSASSLEEGIRRSPVFIISSLAAAVASGAGSLALLLAVVGIFGTVSHIVVMRTREIGIRMALGARRGEVLRLILGQSTRPVLAGLTCGTIVAAGVVRLLRGILFGVNAADGVFFAALAMMVFIVSLVASYPPARRAMRIDPIEALRCE